MGVNTKTKDEVAKVLAQAHRKSEPTITAIYQVCSKTHEQDPQEPIKLLEVNPDTIPAGIMPVIFGPGGDITYPFIVIEVTSEEFDDLQDGKLQLPDPDWEIKEQL